MPVIPQSRPVAEVRLRGLGLTKWALDWAKWSATYLSWATGLPVAECDDIIAEAIEARSPKP